MRVPLCCILLLAGCGCAAAPSGGPEAPPPVGSDDQGLGRGTTVQDSRSAGISPSGTGVQTGGGGAPGAEPAGASRPDAPALPAISTYRYDEDYAVLRNASPAQDADPLSLAPLKYMPLGDGGPSYLTLGSEFRLRYEFYGNNLWGQGPQDDGGYLWGRAMPYADLHVGPNFRAFGQLIAAFEWGDEAGVSPPDEDRLDLLQGFVDVRVPVADDASLLLRPGRQLLRYGSERLIGVRYGPNVPQPFDAALARLEQGPWRVDAFYARPVEIGPGEWDDETDDAQSAWSAYATRKLPSLGAGSGVDAYYIGYLNREAEFAQGGGRELRHTLGTRFFGENRGFDWDLEGFYQFGSFDPAAGGRGDISAWSVASNVGYTFERAPFRPRLGLRANVISGDDDPDDPDLQTFNALFPKGRYFGEVGLLGPYNLVNLHPTVTLELTEKLALDLAAVFYWRYSTRDGVYDNAGEVIRDGLRSRERYIGTQLEAFLTYAASREVEVSAAYSVFLPGRFVEDTGPDEAVHFVALELIYRF